MKSKFIKYLISLMIFQSIVFANENIVLMPMPNSVKFTNEKFRLDESFNAKIIGNSNSRLRSAISRALQRLVNRTGLFLLNDFLSENFSLQDAPFVISVTREGQLKLDEDESYKIEITANKINLNSTTDLGALHGLETLLQLIDRDEDGYFLQGCVIDDKPKFLWRGLLIDVCRHFIPIEVLKRNIDGMASMKMNVLHLHLSEDQGFRVECKSFPKLHQLGSDGLYYTHEQIKEILSYANSRGIRVIPEFDMPSHTTSWFVGYPFLASKPGPYSIERHWGVFNPTMDPTKESTYEFLDVFVKEMSQLFNDSYFHIGGDENTGKDWNENPEIQKFMIKNKIADNHALQDYFLNRVSKIYSKYNKKIVGWEEVLRQSSSSETIIQTWREDKVLENAIKKGYKVIVSRGYYIDLMYTAENHYLNFVIPKNLKLNDSEKKQILGAEATMWCEFVTTENIDSRIWPRTATIAERFWSSEDVNDIRNMYKRLDVISFKLEELGLMHLKNIDFMMRRITNNSDTKALKIFLGVVEPLKEYNRFDKGKDFTSYSPYTRVMDVATPDAPDARKFSWLVEDFISDTSKKYLLDEINIYLSLWEKNHFELQKIIRVSPILKEVESLSEDLTKCAKIGLEITSVLKNNKSINQNWITSKKSFLKTASETRAQSELMIIKPILKLLDFVIQ